MKRAKKGQSSSITILVVIIISVVILALILWALGYSFSDFTGLLFPSKVNIDKMASKCSNFALTSSKRNLCCEPMSVILKDGEKPVVMRCDDSRLNVAEAQASCNFLVSCSGEICFGDVRTKTCNAGEKTDTTKIWKQTGEIIEKGDVCCTTPGQACTDKTGANNGKAMWCYAENCPDATTQISGTFSDAPSNEGKVCCSIKCTT